MGNFAVFLTSVFSGLFSVLATYFGKKLAYGAAVTATLLAVAVAFYAVIHGLLVGVTVTISNPYFQMVFHSILPSNFATCIAAMLSADVAAFLYRHQVATIKAVSGAT